MKDSIVVAYDWIRGEPRGKIRKKKPAESDQPALAEAPTQGDCIDCKLCVQVCPTGIDIRNGTQLECVNCTACIDACNEVMEKVKRPKGLIRYDSLTGIQEGIRNLFTARVKAYIAVLILLVTLQAFLFITRSEVEAVVLRTPGMLYQTVDDVYISNLYNFQVINKTTKEITDIEFRLLSPHGRIKLVGIIPPAPKQNMAEGAFFIEMEKDKLTDRKTKLQMEVYAGDKLIDKATTNFLGPMQ